MNQAPPTPKGFRDILPPLAKKRREVVNKIAFVLEEAGFVPIETPIVEFAETLTGKYGEEEKLIYKFTDRGERELALRYDLTVPLARFIASNLSLIASGPFRRYQVGEVFRGENPQKGRFRQFTQFDMDSVGSNDSTEDALVIASALKAAKAAGLKNPFMIINDRANFEGLSPEVVRAIDKLEKIDENGVLEEMRSKNIDSPEAILEKIKNLEPSDNLKEIFEKLKGLGITEDQLKFMPTLARGLDYYTGMIVELRDSNYGDLSLGGGGRYDNLIGSFAKKDIPAVGFSFGLDRLIECLEET